MCHLKIINFKNLLRETFINLRNDLWLFAVPKNGRNSVLLQQSREK